MHGGPGDVPKTAEQDLARRMFEHDPFKEEEPPQTPQHKESCQNPLPVPPQDPVTQEEKQEE